MYLYWGEIFFPVVLTTITACTSHVTYQFLPGLGLKGFQNISDTFELHLLPILSPLSLSAPLCQNCGSIILKTALNDNLMGMRSLYSSFCTEKSAPACPLYRRRHSGRNTCRLKHISERVTMSLLVFSKQYVGKPSGIDIPLASLHGAGPFTK